MPTPDKRKEMEKAALKFLHDRRHRKEDLKQLIADMPPLNIYRTPPNEANRTRLSCITMSLRANKDLRSYLVVNSEYSIDDVSAEALSQLPDLELWKQNADPDEALFFFRRNTEAGYYDETKLIVDRGWLELENNMGWEWSFYRETKERKERWEALSEEEEKARIKESSRKNAAETRSIFLSQKRRGQLKKLKQTILSWLPWD